MPSLLIKNGTVIAGDLGQGGAVQVLKNHSIRIDGGKIQSIFPQQTDAPAGNTLADESVIDAAGKLVMPGFINAHTHFYSSFARGLGKAAPAKNFTEVLNHLWWRLDRKLTVEDSAMSARVACIEAIKHGTTTLIDHQASPFAIRGVLSAIAGAVTDTGVRASLCYEVSDRDGEAVTQAGIDENLDFLKSREQNKSSGFVKALFGLHASFTLSDKTLKTVSEKSQGLKIGFHIHVAEDISDQIDSQAKYGIRVVERLQKFGILGPDTICAHCVHVNDAELDVLKKTKSIVVHNPQSNMNNSVGAANLVKMRNMGILVGLGTDAMTTNMLEELRAAVWLQKHSLHNPSVGFAESVEALMFGNNQIARRFWGPELGGLFVGARADMALIDYDPPTELNSDNFAGHLVFGISQAPVDTTICDGRILMRDKKLVHINEADVMREARELSARLWARF